jgi:hypothetical protein
MVVLTPALYERLTRLGVDSVDAQPWLRPDFAR